MGGKIEFLFYFYQFNIDIDILGPLLRAVDNKRLNYR